MLGYFSKGGGGAGGQSSQCDDEGISPPQLPIKAEDLLKVKQRQCECFDYQEN